MGAKMEQIRRKSRNGGVLDSVPDGATIVVGTLKVVDGKRYLSLTDGRIVRSPIEVFRITGGKVVRTIEG